VPISGIIVNKRLRIFTLHYAQLKPDIFPRRAAGPPPSPCTSALIAFSKVLARLTLAVQPEARISGEKKIER
jgi:hypothetical protein